MKSGHLVLFVAIAVYAAAEAYAASKNRYRMQADYIYPQLVAADVAMERCGGATTADRAGFDAVRARERGRLERELSAETPSADGSAIGARIEELTRGAEAELLAALDAEGCDGPTVRRSLGHFRIYARK